MVVHWTGAANHVPLYQSISGGLLANRLVPSRNKPAATISMREALNPRLPFSASIDFRTSDIPRTIPGNPSRVNLRA